MPVASEARALTVPPTLVNRPNVATTKIPALPKAEAYSTSDAMLSEASASVHAHRPSASTPARDHRSLAPSERSGRSVSSTLWVISAEPASRIESTVDRMAEMSAPVNST